MQKALAAKGADLHAVAASGGNAGLAVACAAHELGVRCTIYLPEGASENVLAFFKRQKANIKVKGKIYAEALKGAEEEVAADEKA